MPLIDKMAVPCVFVDAQRIPDGSGGYKTTWTDGKRFMAAIVRNSATRQKVAEAAAEVATYTVTVPRSVHLPFHAVIKRLSDGATFRITSDNAENKAPSFSGLDMAQSSAEAWGLTE